ncbi:MAG: efflux RND transporter permease subunit, partial [Firmicutes bacterium]|nr:efflux RND transporter permease subunit [Bacillota bacterium]
DGYTYEIQGLADTMTEMFGSLFKALVVAIALVFLVLAAQFESMTMAFIVMMAIPFAMTGAFIAMFLTGTKMSLTSLLGLVLLVGTVVNNSILLVEFINQNKHSMGREEAMVAAGKQRLRPILMTTLTTIVGMIPLSLGYGEGGEILAPMGISIIGGLLTSTLLTLIVIPCMYKLVEERRDASAAKAEARAAEIAALEAKWAEEDAKGN